MPLPHYQIWQAEWGGALELYPTREGKDGVPEPEAIPSKCIPPSWNQFIFFEVQPGKSFHSVEEVVVGEGEDGRQRLSISGWFHAAQPGEEGYDPNEKHGEFKSSRDQLVSCTTTYILRAFTVTLHRHPPRPRSSPIPRTSNPPCLLPHSQLNTYLSFPNSSIRFTYNLAPSPLSQTALSKNHPSNSTPSSPSLSPLNSLLVSQQTTYEITSALTESNVSLRTPRVPLLTRPTPPPNGRSEVPHTNGVTAHYPPYPQTSPGKLSSHVVRYLLQMPLFGASKMSSSPHPRSARGWRTCRVCCR